MNGKSNFDNSLVAKISDYLQTYMKKNGINSLTADECAEILAKNKILPNDIGPKPGFNFRQMLRDGRDKKIDLMKGAYQESPRKRWQINRIAQ
jgi:hypothetical protein